MKCETALPEIWLCEERVPKPRSVPVPLERTCARAHERTGQCVCERLRVYGCWAFLSKGSVAMTGRNVLKECCYCRAGHVSPKLPLVLVSGPNFQKQIKKKLGIPEAEDFELCFCLYRSETEKKNTKQKKKKKERKKKERKEA